MKFGLRVHFSTTTENAHSEEPEGSSDLFFTDIRIPSLCSMIASVSESNKVRFKSQFYFLTNFISISPNFYFL